MQKFLPPLLLLGLLIIFRFVKAIWPESLPIGFEPLSAVLFCAAACIGLKWLWLPACALLVTYPPTSAIMGSGFSWQFVLVFAGYAAAVWMGTFVRGRGGFALLGGAAVAAVLFYLVTGLGSWLLLPDYPKTGEGLIQALWTGGPHHLVPSWYFLRGALGANLLFTGLFLLGQRRLLPRALPLPAAEPKARG